MNTFELSQLLSDCILTDFDRKSYYHQDKSDPSDNGFCPKGKDVNTMSHDFSSKIPYSLNLVLPATPAQHHITFPYSIGLSGASGFLGLHLVKELTSTPVEKIVCFVRSEEKFKEKKAQFRLDFDESKIEFRHTWAGLSEITHFIHSAAQIHSLKNLEQMWEDNVVLTKDILSALRGKIYYISSLSVFASAAIKGNKISYKAKNTLLFPDKKHHIHGGYAQTKWLSEYLVSHYHDASIFRLGLLTPSHHYPIFQKHEFFFVFISLLKELKIYPESYEEAYVDISPVDDVAKTIVNNILSRKQVMHIAARNATSLSSILAKLELSPVSDTVWLGRMAKLKKTHQILLYYAFFKTKAIKEYPQYYNIDLFQSTGYDWGGEIESEQMVERYISSI